jgi:hypothetical protein
MSAALVLIVMDRRVTRSQAAKRGACGQLVPAAKAIPTQMASGPVKSSNIMGSTADQSRTTKPFARGESMCAFGIEPSHDWDSGTACVQSVVVL